MLLEVAVSKHTTTAAFTMWQWCIQWLLMCAEVNSNHTDLSVQTPCSLTRKLRTEYHWRNASDFCWRSCLRKVL